MVKEGHMEERMRRRRRVREGKRKTKPKTEIVQVTCHAGTEPRALECLQCLCSLHCLHGDRRLVPKRTVTIRYAYRLPEAANLKGQLVTAGNTIQGERSRFLAVLLDIICFFLIILRQSVIHRLYLSSLFPYTSVYVALLSQSA